MVAAAAERATCTTLLIDGKNRSKFEIKIFFKKSNRIESSIENTESSITNYCVAEVLS